MADKLLAGDDANDSSRPANPSNIVSPCGSDIQYPFANKSQAPVVLVAQLDSNWLAACILSMGMVAAVIIFVIQAFAHPSAATVLLPLIMAPLSIVIQQCVKGKKCIECPNCKTTIVANGQVKKFG